MSKTKKIIINLSEDDYEYIKTQAELCDMSINAYARRKITDRADTIRVQKEASTVMANLYHLADKTEDLYVRDHLRKWGDELCRCLKW